VDEAHRLNHRYIRTEHLLLGLVREDEDVAAQVLQSLGVNLEKVRIHTIQVLSQSGAPHVVSRSRFAQTHFTQSEMEVGEERFDTFTVQVSRVLSRAEVEAQGFQHNYIGTEHLMLALTHESKSVTAKVLNNLGVELNKIRSTVVFNIGRGDRIVLGEIGPTPRAKKVIELAVDEARRMKHHYVGIEHPLLGLIREGEGIAAGVLESLGVNWEKARTATLRVLGEEDEESGQRQGQDDKESGQAPGDESTASSQQPIQDEDDRIQELSQEEKDFIQTLAALSQDDRDSFDKFTVRARRVLRFAREEAERFQHNYIGTEHLLLGLVRENGGIATAVLRNLGVELNKVRSAVEFMIGRGDHIVSGPMILTPRATKVLDLAADDARRLNHDYIGTEHLLLGLVREGEGIAAGILESLGVRMKKVRTETIKALNQQNNS
jgi:ATP-dependent Clp protease ATP-binding subunit ClpA